MSIDCHHNKSRLNPQGERLSVVETLDFSSIESTNSWGKKNFDRWPAKGILCVRASEQTAGRGRWKRTWTSPPGVNCYASFCFWIDPERKDVGNIPQMMALAAVKTLEEIHFDAKIKWPNDLLLSEKKVGGILCETVMDQGRLGIVCGIGLNINMEPADLEAIGRPATSLFAETGQVYDLKEIFDLLKNNFEVLLSQFLMEGFSPFYAKLVEKSPFKIGDPISFHCGGETICGQWNRMTEEGAVELTLPDGSKQIFYSGEFLSA